MHINFVLVSLLLHEFLWMSLLSVTLEKPQDVVVVDFLADACMHVDVALSVRKLSVCG